jgi:hypothetical protein
MREFETGATRDDDDHKLDYEGFLCPGVLERYAEYMREHRKQADGKLRASDNWMKGIPEAAYMKSLWRHFMDVWSFRRGYSITVDYEDALCAVLFNVMGLLHERLKLTGYYHKEESDASGDTEGVGEDTPPENDLCKKSDPCCTEDEDYARYLGTYGGL